MRPRICFGMALYNNSTYLPQAIESLLTQTYGDFRLVAVDDGSTDDTEDIMQQYLSQDKRLSYYRNESRQGMIATWRRAFTEAQQEPIDYFAWASDHDVWHPRWLETMVQTLEQHEDVVLVYPLTLRISGSGEALPHPSPVFDTFGLTPADRMRAVTARMMGAGNMVYGLFRADILAKAGVFRSFLLPDVMLMLELALFGSFKQVPETLWHRRFVGRFSVKRQRTSLFSQENPMPVYCYLPYWIPHSAFLAWRSAGASLDGADASRSLGLKLATLHLKTRASQDIVRFTRRFLRLGPKLWEYVSKIE